MSIKRNEQTGKVILTKETIEKMSQEELAFIMFESIAYIEGWDFQANEASLEVAKVFREAAFYYKSQKISPHDDKELYRWFFSNVNGEMRFKIAPSNLKSPIITPSYKPNQRIILP